MLLNPIGTSKPTDSRIAPAADQATTESKKIVQIKDENFGFIRRFFNQFFQWYVECTIQNEKTWVLSENFVLKTGFAPTKNSIEHYFKNKSTFEKQSKDQPKLSVDLVIKKSSVSERINRLIRKINEFFKSPINLL